jgi:hypothetical protein
MKGNRRRLEKEGTEMGRVIIKDSTGKKRGTEMGPIKIK